MSGKIGKYPPFLSSIAHFVNYYEKKHYFAKKCLTSTFNHMYIALGLIVIQGF
jgi:hypothetical protein